MNYELREKDFEFTISNS